MELIRTTSCGRESAVHVPEDVDLVKYVLLLFAGVTVSDGIRQMSVTAGELVAVHGIGSLDMWLYSTPLE